MFLVFHIQNRTFYYMISPSRTSFPKVKKSFKEAFNIDLDNFVLSFKDIENEFIEVSDELDFDYMVNQVRKRPGNVHIYTRLLHESATDTTFAIFEEKGDYSIPDMKSHKEEPIIVCDASVGNKPANKVDSKELSKSFELERNSIEQTCEQSDLADLVNKIKTKAVNTTNLEINQKLDHLSTKIDQMAELIEQNMKESRSELRWEIEKLNKDSQYTLPSSSGVHKNIYCNKCKKVEFSGKRYKCLVCYDYDLCENCERKGNHLHPMLKIDASNDKSDMNSLCKMNHFQEKSAADYHSKSKIEFLKQLTSERFTDKFYENLVGQYNILSLEKFMHEMEKLFK